MWYVCDVLYAVLYVRVICFVVRGCAILLLFATTMSVVKSVKVPVVEVAKRTN